MRKAVLAVLSEARSSACTSSIAGFKAKYLGPILVANLQIRGPPSDIHEIAGCSSLIIWSWWYIWHGSRYPASFAVISANHGISCRAVPWDEHELESIVRTHRVSCLMQPQVLTKLGAHACHNLPSAQGEDTASLHDSSTYFQNLPWKICLVTPQIFHPVNDRMSRW